MLPSDLLTVRTRKGLIWPRYAGVSDENLEVATRLIQAYKSHVGSKKHILKEIAGELEGGVHDYRFIRGLSALLDRKSVFECNARNDPIDLRRQIFQATGKLGPSTTSRKRKRIVGSVASELGLSADLVEEALYADLDSELILREFVPLPPVRLIEDYNVSLTQTLLFNSTQLSFTASGNWQRIFYTIKRLGLIYEVSRDADFWVRIDGPASLFKMTRRYGTALARLFPVIITNRKWTIEAKILWKYTNKIYDFKISSGQQSRMFGEPVDLGVTFDSNVEADIAQRFGALNSGWRLRREPEPVPAGRHVIIPDFSFEKGGVQVLMEVVGFWTLEYLRRKIEKLKKIDVGMILAVDEDLTCRKLTKLEENRKLKIIYYRNKIPLAPLLRYLEEAFQQVEKKQASFLKNLRVKFVEPVLDYEEFATRIGVSTESVRSVLTERPPEGYVVLPNILVKKDKLEEIGKTIEDYISPMGRTSLPEASKIIKEEGVEDVSNVLKVLGYRIVWRGINPETAEVVKPEDEQERTNPD